MARLPLALFVIAAAVVLLGSAPAEACSCIVHLAQAWPDNGATDVPLDAALIQPNAGTDVELTGEDGTVFVTTTTQINASTFGGVTVFKPQALLEPDTEYTARFSDDSGTTSTWTFRTGTERAPAAAPAGVVVGEGWSTMEVPPNLGCGSPSHGVGVDIALPEGGIAALIDLEGARPSLDGADLDIAVVASPFRQDSREVTVALGQGGCAFGWPEATGGARAEVHVGVLDQAGRLTWQEPEPAQLPTTAIVPGCSQATAPSLGGFLLLLGLFAGVRRRRGTGASR